jgi:uncharacterized NAD(P)/FAD-binding protein YdhS
LIQRLGAEQGQEFEMDFDIVIVGAGVSSTYMLYHLLKEGLHPKLKICVIERGSRFGAGMPYSPDWCSEHHLSNIAPREIPELLGSAADYFCNNDPQFTPSRLKLGSYFEKEFEDIIEQIRVTCEVTLHKNTDVTGITYHSGLEQFSVFTTRQQHSEIRTSKLVVATGHTWEDNKLTRDDDIIPCPWPIENLEVKSRGSFGVIGTGLTAIDTILHIAFSNGCFQRDYTGELRYRRSLNAKFSIYMMSRKGLLPGTRFYFEYHRISPNLYVTEDEAIAWVDLHDGQLPLDLLFQEIFLRNLADVAPDLHGHVHQMSVEEFVDEMMIVKRSECEFEELQKNLGLSLLSLADRRSIAWRELFDDFCYMVSYYSEFLTYADRIRFKQTIYPLLQLIVGYLPTVTAERLLAMRKAGVLEIIRLGSSYKLRKSTSGWSVDTPNLAQQLSLDYIVDCRGQKDLERNKPNMDYISHQKQTKTAPRRRRNLT